MAYTPATENDIKEMLKTVEVKSIDDLFDIISTKYKFDINSLDFHDGYSEQDMESKLVNISNMNLNSTNSINFMGGGAYDHYVPKIIDTISSRSEFYTAYTPYQPEVSQGTLQYLYEFQTMICELSGMDIANASLYDGASSVAEACAMAMSCTRKNKILISTTLNPNYVEVINIYFKNRKVDIEMISSSDGITSFNDFESKLDDNTACIVIQSPNYYGLLENWNNYGEKKNKALLIGVSDPISLSLIKSPGKSKCDVYVGEGQSLGNYISYGGPYIGLFSTKMKYARKMPGRIIGRTVDVDNKEGFVMTLQTREQHIRRDKATSNICTNQGLLTLRCTIYMALMGKNGINSIAKTCYNNAQYAAAELNKLSNIKLYYENKSFVKEFVVKTHVSAKKIQKEALKRNILIDCLSDDKTDSLLLLAFTEKRNKKEIDTLVSFLDQC